MSFSIDGLVWPYPCQIERVAELKASELSGLMLDLSYFNDAQGTWMRYTVTLAVPFGYEDDYAAIYEQLTKPVDGHQFVMPYNNSDITLTARVLQVSDALVRMPGDKRYWKGTTFEIVANQPSKLTTLNETLIRGRTPWPDLAVVTVGDTYTYTENGWQPAQSYPDGDIMYF